MPSVDEGKDESQKKNKIDPASTTESTESNILTEPSFETSDETTKPQKRIKRFFEKTIYGFYIILFRSQKSFESGDENGLTAENCALLADLVEINQSLIVFAVRNSKNHSLVDRLTQLNQKNERIHFFDLFKGMVNIKLVLLSWFSPEDPILRDFILTANKENLAEAFHIIVKKIHQINLKQKLKVSHLIKVGCVFPMVI